MNKTNKQYISRNIEIKNKLTVTRGEEGEGYWGKIREGPSRNMYKGHMEKAKGGKVSGWGGGNGGVKLDNCIRSIKND